jgi:two-component system sensor histidine kinase KdpD
MDGNRFPTLLRLLRECFLAVGSVFAVTIPLGLLGSGILGDAVIALLYLLPIAWSAGRWGLVPGLSAGLAAALCFDFLFVPPFHTFAVGSLEGWLVLSIFLGVAVFVVDRIQSNLIKAREAVFLYELSTALAGKRTQEAVAHTVARQIQQLFQADTVNVCYRPAVGVGPFSIGEVRRPVAEEPPDRTIPIENTWGLVGEIQIWRGPVGALPAEGSRILSNFSWLTAEALERTRAMESREKELATSASPLPSSRTPD